MEGRAKTTREGKRRRSSTVVVVDLTGTRQVLKGPDMICS